MPPIVRDDVVPCLRPAIESNDQIGVATPCQEVDHRPLPAIAKGQVHDEDRSGRLRHYSHREPSDLPTLPEPPPKSDASDLVKRSIVSDNTPRPRRCSTPCFMVIAPSFTPIVSAIDSDVSAGSSSLITQFS